jgi:dihydrolipoamide dehydrogenase
MAKSITIIGAGPGGYVAALRAAQMGAQVTLVERAEVGGTCLNQGCIPTKTLVASAEALALVREAGEFGIDLTGTAAFNLARIRERKDKVVATQVKGIRSLLKSWGVLVLAGKGTLLAPGAVRVELQDGTATEVRSDSIIIATGSRPARIPGFPFDGERVITSDEAVQFRTVPQRLLIVGAGVIGSEFAFIYRTFGAEVTIIDLLPRPLATEDEEISRLMEREMKKVKIRLLTGLSVGSITVTGSGVQAVLSDGKELAVDQVLVSIGRAMNSADLGLEQLGVATGKRGEIVVNDRMETNVPGLYAVGDVTGKVMLAHVASRQGVVAVENALGGSAVMEYSAIPAGIFTMPEIGSVGMTEQAARERGVPVRIGRFAYRGLGKAHAMAAIVGMVKIVSHAETDRVLGMHICGAHATDMIHEGALAVSSGVTARELGRMVHAHPTLAEAVMEAAEDVHGMAVHLPKPGKASVQSGE